MDSRIIAAFLTSMVLVGAANLQHHSDGREYADLGGVEDSNLDTSLVDLFLSSARDSNTDHYHDAQSYPYQQEVLPSAEASVSVSKPAVQINKEFSVVKPQVEVLRLVEGFIRLKGELITRAQALLNENYDLVRSVVNLVLDKLGHLQSFSLQGISVLRQIIEFTLNIFSSWNIGSSLSLGLDKDVHVEKPHEVLW